MRGGVQKKRVVVNSEIKKGGVRGVGVQKKRVVTSEIKKEEVREGGFRR